jgi:purine-nucleoside phosphorylase
VFYHEGIANEILWEKIRQEDLLCVEMESFALFHNAAVLGRQAACLLTISDSLVTGEELDADTRATAFSDMVTLALEAAIA